MEATFSAHEFIRVLARDSQGEYVRALAKHADGGAPFQIVHKQVADELRKSPEVEYLGEVQSVNIWGDDGKCSQWKKS